MLEIGNIKLKHPVLLGGMGVGVTLSGLASAVSKAGGLGVISAAQPGYDKEGFDSENRKCNIDALKSHIKKVKEVGYVGVNLMAAGNGYNEFAKACIDAGADIIISGAGIAKELPKIVEGTSTACAPIFSSLKATKTVLNIWDKKYNLMPDAVIIEGPMAGGHLGFKADYLINDDFSGMDEELSKIITFVKEYENKYDKKIPVIFGGGVFTKKDVDHYLNLGCSGVQVATKFVATYECDAHENFKQAYINAKSEDVQIVQSPVGMPGRAITNKFLEEKHELNIKKCYKCLSKCDAKTIPYCITDALITSVSGDMDNGLIFAGRRVGEVTEMKTVQQVMDELTI